MDAFLKGILEELPGDALLVLACNHGNVEEVGQGGSSSHPRLRSPRRGPAAPFRSP